MIDITIKIEQQGERVSYVYLAQANETTTEVEMEATERVIAIIQGYIVEIGGTGSGVSRKGDDRN